MEFKDSICCKCFGCDLLELEDFDYAIVCKNFIQAEETEDENRDTV